MKRIMMLCLALLAGGAVSAKAQTRVGVAFSVGGPFFGGFVTVGQPWYWYHGYRVYYVRRVYDGRPRYFYDPRFVPDGWRDHDRGFFERDRDWDRGWNRRDHDRDFDRHDDRDRGRGHDRGRHRGRDRDR